jgi:hypothetical protein
MKKARGRGDARDRAFSAQNSSMAPPCFRSVMSCRWMMDGLQVMVTIGDIKMIKIFQLL